VRPVIEAYEAKVRELESRNEEKTRWALDTNATLEQKGAELAQCVELLHRSEHTVAEQTAFVEKLKVQIYHLEKQVTMMKESRWVKLGRRFGLGPDLRDR